MGTRRHKRTGRRRQRVGTIPNLSSLRLTLRYSAPTCIRRCSSPPTVQSKRSSELKHIDFTPHLCATKCAAHLPPDPPALVRWRPPPALRLAAAVPSAAKDVISHIRTMPRPPDKEAEGKKKKREEKKMITSARSQDVSFQSQI